jgi:hypothetical protein
MTRAPLLAAWLLPLAWLGTAPASAATVYKCTDSQGRVAYQDTPCSEAQRQQSLDLPDDAPVAMPPPAAAEEVEAAAIQPTPRPRPPPAPLPAMYACIRATDGQPYDSSNGQPRPYQVPFGMLGAVQLPLSQVYGPGGGGGASAPELNRGKITSGLVANYYVWVQDQCRPLSRRETCAALRDAYDKNADELRRAFQSDQPPLEKRDKELRSQLDGC